MPFKFSTAIGAGLIKPGDRLRIVARCRAADVDALLTEAKVYDKRLQIYAPDQKKWVETKGTQEQAVYEWRTAAEACGAAIKPPGPRVPIRDWAETEDGLSLNQLLERMEAQRAGTKRKQQTGTGAAAQAAASPSVSLSGDVVSSLTETQTSSAIASVGERWGYGLAVQPFGYVVASDATQDQISHDYSLLQHNVGRAAVIFDGHDGLGSFAPIKEVFGGGVAAMKVIVDRLNPYALRGSELLELCSSFGGRIGEIERSVLSLMDAVAYISSGGSSGGGGCRGGGSSSDSGSDIGCVDKIGGVQEAIEAVFDELNERMGVCRQAVAALRLHKLQAVSTPGAVPFIAAADEFDGEMGKVKAAFGSFVAECSNLLKVLSDVLG